MYDPMKDLSSTEDAQALSEYYEKAMNLVYHLVVPICWECYIQLLNVFFQ